MLVANISRYALRTTKIRNNHTGFMDLIKTPSGIQIPITPEEKIKINQQIDKKMQQLQDTGLSREQILLSKSQKGLPLSIDPFFQYLKKNKLARQVYLKKNDRFCLQKVIDIALRQDIGPDASYSRTRLQGQINEKGRAQLMGNLPEKSQTAFDPASYYANHQTTIPKLYDELRPHQPLRHIFRPVFRYEKIKTHMRKLKKYDIHWRNVQLLRQFLTPFGNIRNRLANCLSSADQKKIMMAIKTARHNAAIPHYGRILPPNKKNITNIEDEVRQTALQNINLENGQIYYSRSRSMDSIQVQNDKKSDLDYKYQKLIKNKKFTLWSQQAQEIKQEVLKAEQYARAQKLQENKKNGRDKQSMKLDIRKFAAKQTGFSDADNIRIQQDKSDTALQCFEKRKTEVKNKLSSNIFLFSEIILEQKTI